MATCLYYIAAGAMGLLLNYAGIGATTPIFWAILACVFIMMLTLNH